MGEIYRLRRRHRQAHAERGDLYSKLTDALVWYDGPQYRSPAGHAVFSREEHEAAFQRAYLAEYGIEHMDPRAAQEAAAAPEPESFMRMERDNAFISVPEVGNVCGMAAAEPMLRATLTVMTGGLPDGASALFMTTGSLQAESGRMVDLGAAEPVLEMLSYGDGEVRKFQCSRSGGCPRPRSSVSSRSATVRVSRSRWVSGSG